MDDYDFEHFVADLWTRQGWTTEVSQASVDAGIDVTATKQSPYPQKKLIQAKRYGPNTTVGGPDIQQYASLKHQGENVDSVAVVTSNRFTRHAEERAQELNVKTVDGDGLVALLEELRAYDLLEKYPVDGGATSTATNQPTTGGAGAGSSAPKSRNKSEFSTAGNTQGSSGSDALSLLRSIWSRGSSMGAETLPLTSVVPERENYHYAIPVGVVLAFVVTNTSFSGLIVPFVMLSIVVMYADMTQVRRLSDWRPSALLYSVGMLFLSPLVTPYYLYKRWRMV